MLALSDVGVHYRDKAIVSHVSLQLEAGAIHALMGPNGSGKSTLSMALAGYPEYALTASSHVTLDGINLLELLPHERARAGLFLTFQNPVAIPGISVEQMMKVMSDHIHGEKLPIKTFIEKLNRYAELVGVKPEFLKRSINDGFSGGEKKLIEMLSLLLAHPKYALLDEIDSGLDVDAIKMMSKTITLAQTEFNTGFLIVTHYRRILEYLPVNEVHVLANGKMIKSGDKQIIAQIEADGYQGLL